jgi:hypothetical protein
MVNLAKGPSGVGPKSPYQSKNATVMLASASQKAHSLAPGGWRARSEIPAFLQAKTRLFGLAAIPILTSVAEI